MCGYERVVKQVSARTTARELLTHKKVAFHACKTVWKSMEEHGGQWNLEGGTTVRYDDVVLLGLRRMLEATWQLDLAFLYNSV